jgi:hypothetical protein
MNSDKSQTSSLVRDEPEVPVKHYALLEDLARQPRGRSRRPRALITVALVVVGLLAGWLGGISLTGAFQRAKTDANVPPNVQMQETGVPASQPQPDTRSSANVIAPAGKSARPRDAQADPEPAVELQPPRATLVEEDKRQEDRKVEVPTGEQATKEIGQTAMDKILKENDKIKRGKHLKANKNEE